MFRLQWHILPENKCIRIALTMVYGIGRNISKDILNKHNIDLLKKTRDLTDEEQKILSDEIKEMIVENDLRREVGNHIKRLKEIKCYRWMRHNLWLPVRWQSTLRHAKTAKKLLGRAKVRPTLKK